MAVRLNLSPEVDSLCIQLSNTLAQIDASLDCGDRRAFKVWSGRYGALSNRLATLLTKIATTRET